MKRKLKIIIPLIILLFAAGLIICEKEARTFPIAERMNISGLLTKENLSEDDYKILMQQTGLGRAAVCDIKNSSDNFKEDILAFQEQFFEKTDYKCEYLFPITNEERLFYSDGRRKNIMLAPVKDGDILITRATHSLGFRHGHAAIVIDAENEKTLESVVLGTKSAVQELDKWRNYPTVLILRPKDSKTAEKAAQYAKESLVNVDYGLFVGILKKDKQHMDIIDSTQCAHLVWQAYYAAGEDIDSDGWLVIPDDISQNTNLEVVFAYGFDPITRK